MVSGDGNFRIYCQRHGVLILILMEDGFWSMIKNFEKKILLCLNPYSDGRWFLGNGSGGTFDEWKIGS